MSSPRDESSGPPRATTISRVLAGGLNGLCSEISAENRLSTRTRAKSPRGIGITRVDIFSNSVQTPKRLWPVSQLHRTNFCHVLATSSSLENSPLPACGKPGVKYSIVPPSTGREAGWRLRPGIPREFADGLNSLIQQRCHKSTTAFFCAAARWISVALIERRTAAPPFPGLRCTPGCIPCIQVTSYDSVLSAAILLIYGRIRLALTPQCSTTSLLVIEDCKSRRGGDYP
jgi:hypothetical protein